MSAEDAPRDGNFVPASLFQIEGAARGQLMAGQIDQATGRILTDSAGGSGTVTSVSVVSANGFAGTVATATTTPAITLSTTITGLLKGNGTAISAASSSTDYAALAFKTISVSGQSDVVADSPIDTLTLVGSGITITTDATTDTITFTGAAASLTVGTTTIASGTTTRILYDNAGVLGEYTISGSGTAVAMATSPVLTTPNIGVATATSVNGLTITGSTGTFTLTNAKVLTVSNTLTFTGTDGSSVAFGTGGTVLYTASTIPLTVGSTTIASGTTTRILYDNAGVLGEYTLTGSGTVVAMQTAPSFLTSITTPSVLASSNDSGALGASGTAFADLFLASGGVINWAAGDYTLTHSSGVLTANKDLRVTTVGTDNTSVVTIAGTQTLTNKTLTSPTLTTPSAFTTGGTITLAENTTIALDPAGSADGKYTGITVTGVAGYAQTYGDLVYLAVADSRWELADADAAATAGPVALAMVVVAGGSDGAACTLLLQGIIRADAKFPTMTVGATQFVGETAGAIQGAIPTGADNIIRTVGYALTADELYFNPSTDWQVTVA